MVWKNIDIEIYKIDLEKLKHYLNHHKNKLQKSTVKLFDAA